MTAKIIIQELRRQANPKNVAGMMRFGIRSDGTLLGISIPWLRRKARGVGKNHGLALQLWRANIHEARLLAAFIEEPEKVTARQMDTWAGQFDSWDICDQVCSNVFDRTPFAYHKARRWVRDRREFVRRAGFAMMAALAVHDKGAPDARFVAFLPTIKRYATHERNFVKKSVNWALRQIGKRNAALRKQAIRTAKEIEQMESASARWIAKDALRELGRR